MFVRWKSRGVERASRGVGRCRGGFESESFWMEEIRRELLSRFQMPGSKWDFYGRDNGLGGAEGGLSGLVVCFERLIFRHRAWAIAAQAFDSATHN